MSRLGLICSAVVLVGCSAAQGPADSGTGGGAGGNGGAGGGQADVFEGAWTLSGTLTVNPGPNQTNAQIASPLSVVKASDGNYRFEYRSCSLVYVRDAQATPPKLDALANTACTLPGDAPVTVNGTTGTLNAPLGIALTTSTVTFAADVLTITGAGTATANGGAYPMSFNYAAHR